MNRQTRVLSSGEAIQRMVDLVRMKTASAYDITILFGQQVVKTMGADTLAEAQKKAWEEIRMNEFAMGYRIAQVVPSKNGDRCMKLVDVSDEFRYASPMERFSLAVQRAS